MNKPNTPPRGRAAGVVALVPLAKLRCADWNPRQATDERLLNLKAAIAADPEFLWSRPILADASGEVYAGNHRLQAARLLDEEGHWPWPGQVPAVLEDVSPQLARERAIRDNEQWAAWQDDQIAEIVRGLEDAGSAIDLLGFDGDELTRLLDGVEAETPAAAKEEQDQQWKSRYELVIECGSEEQQELLFHRFSDEGLKCRVLTL